MTKFYQESPHRPTIQTKTYECMFNSMHVNSGKIVSAVQAPILLPSHVVLCAPPFTRPLIRVGTRAKTFTSNHDRSPTHIRNSFDEHKACTIHFLDVFLISIAHQIIAKIRFDLVQLSPDRLKAIVYKVNQIDYCFQGGDLGKVAKNPIVNQQQPNRQCRSEISPFTLKVELTF